MNLVFDKPEVYLTYRELSALFSYISQTQLGNKALFDFLSSNVDKIFSDLPDGMAFDLFNSLTSAATDDKIIKKVSFFEYFLYKSKNVIFVNFCQIQSNLFRHST